MQQLLQASAVFGIIALIIWGMWRVTFLGFREGGQR